MQYDLVFLHTAPVHIDTFTQLADKWLPGIAVQHLVDEALLSEAQGWAELPESLITRIQAAVKTAVEMAPVVCCTCSTIGGAVEQTFADCTEKYSIRIDRPMADQAVQHAKRIKILAALESTIGPTEQLLHSSAQHLGRQVELETEVIEGAWKAFLSGDVTNYHQTIAQRLHQLKGKCELIVLAQASMAPAARLVTLECPVLSSPEIGVKALAETLKDVAVGNGH